MVVAVALKSYEGTVLRLFNGSVCWPATTVNTYVCVRKVVSLSPHTGCFDWNAMPDIWHFT